MKVELINKQPKSNKQEIVYEDSVFIFVTVSTMYGVCCLHFALYTFDILFPSNMCTYVRVSLCHRKSKLYNLPSRLSVSLPFLIILLSLTAHMKLIHDSHLHHVYVHFCFAWVPVRHQQTGWLHTVTVSIKDSKKFPVSTCNRMQSTATQHIFCFTIFFQKGHIIWCK